MKLTRKFDYFGDIHFKIITGNMPGNIIPGHIRFLGMSYNF